MKNRSDYWLVAVFLLNVLIAAVVYGELLANIRGYVVFGYLLLCPGLSLAYLLPTNDKLTQTFLVIVLSIGMDAVIAEALLLIEMWSPQLTLLILIIISLSSAVSELYIKIRKDSYSVSKF